MGEQRLIDWATFLYWIGACALGAMLLSAATMLPALLLDHRLGRQIYQAVGGGVIPIVLLGLSLPAALYFVVLRRIAPPLTASSWSMGMALAGLLMAAGTFLHTALAAPLTAILALALPCRIVAKACGRPWRAFISAGTAALCCEFLLGALLNDVSQSASAAHGTWRGLLAQCAVDAALGALWGAVSAGSLAWLTRARRDA
jgi:hypothetical protein